MKTMCMAKVVSQDSLCPGVYSLVLKAPEIAAYAVPGQFVSLYCADESRLLPRPISLCEIWKDRGCLRLVYRIVGAGTKEFSALKSGDSVRVLGPLGNGYPAEVERNQAAILIGGGIGIPPLLELAKQLPCRKNIVLGYKDEVFLEKDFEGLGDIFLASEDGKTGTKGTVMDAIRENGITGDVIYSCGPVPMLRAVKEFGETRGLTAWVSLEERMACGIGACLACVCESTAVDGHSMVKNKRICKDGPVFDSREVVL